MDVKGNWQRWLKVRDLTKGVTYFFRVQARTIAYGPELQANVTAGPAEGEWAELMTELGLVALACSVAWGFRDILKLLGSSSQKMPQKFPKHFVSQAPQCTPGIPALERWRQEAQEFKASLTAELGACLGYKSLSPKRLKRLKADYREHELL